MINGVSVNKNYFCDRYLKKSLGFKNLRSLLVLNSGN